MAHIDPQKIILAWSGGKDSMLALHTLRADARYEIVALLTTVAQEYRRVSHHGVRESLLEQQAAALDIPLQKIYLPATCSNVDYEACMERALAHHLAQGVHWVAHGDIFLADLRAYRERNLAKVGMRGLFPLWGKDSKAIVRTFLTLGYQAYLCCVDAAKLGPEFVGRALDQALLDALPPEVDPCGERGEYHTFVYAGPLFKRPLEVTPSKRVSRGGCHFIDLLPAKSSNSEPTTSPPVPEATPQGTAGG